MKFPAHYTNDAASPWQSSVELPPIVANGELSMSNTVGRHSAHSPHPSVFLLLNLPFGITSGYIVVAIPFLVTRAGLSVLTAASIVGIAITPKALKVLWSPVADVCLTLKRWYVIGATLAGGMLLLQ